MASLAKAPAAYITIAALELPEMVDGVSLEAVPLAAAAAAEDLAAAAGEALAAGAEDLAAGVLDVPDAPFAGAFGAALARGTNGAASEVPTKERRTTERNFILLSKFDLKVSRRKISKLDGRIRPANEIREVDCWIELECCTEEL